MLGIAKSKYVLAGIGCIAGIAIGYTAGHAGFASSSSVYNSITREGGYQYVNPLLSCDISEDSEYAGFHSLKTKLQETAKPLIASGKAKRISVYFRDMNYGAWTGINTDDAYIPASLMKVPLMIAYLKEFQTNPSLRTSQAFLPTGTNWNAEENIDSANDLVLGQSYSIETLVGALIKSSDNNTNALLGGMVATDTLNDVYEQFGIPSAPNDTAETMSPKVYMRFFRILYNASYLSRTNSQSALKLLSETDFKNGIVAGMPASMSVAHKFGERTVYAKNQNTNAFSVVTRELHDCGIVYYPKSPYGICIMTEGNSFEGLESAIAALSQTAYNAVDKGLLSNKE